MDEELQCESKVSYPRTQCGDPGLVFKGTIHLNAIFLPLDMALMAISHSRFKQSKNPISIQESVLWGIL